MIALQVILLAFCAVMTVWILGIGLFSAFHPRVKTATFNVFVGAILLGLTLALPYWYGWYGG